MTTAMGLLRAAAAAVAAAATAAAAAAAVVAEGAGPLAAVAHGWKHRQWHGGWERCCALPAANTTALRACGPSAGGYPPPTSETAAVVLVTSPALSLRYAVYSELAVAAWAAAAQRDISGLQFHVYEVCRGFTFPPPGLLPLCQYGRAARVLTRAITGAAGCGVFGSGPQVDDRPGAEGLEDRAPHWQKVSPAALQPLGWGNS